jgi:DNA-binding transcriptional MerR regulator/quercetin dioxygenase-like cupin family protein
VSRVVAAPERVADTTRTAFEFGISEAARMVGVSAATLRAWERQGLIHPVRSAAGYRRFSIEDVDQLRRVRSMRDVQGFNVPAIRLTLGQPAPPRRTRSARKQQHYSRQLRELRVKHKLSLREASVRTGLSPSFISLIERGLANPSVAVLQKLTAGYGTSIAELLDRPTRPSRKLIRPIDRQVLEGTAGVKLEQLTFGERLMEVHVFTVDPGAGSQEAYQHVGEEFIYMLQGSLEVWLDGFERFTVHPGDMLYFESTQSHRWMNSGDLPAVFLGVNSPATF